MSMSDIKWITWDADGNPVSNKDIHGDFFDAMRYAMGGIKTMTPEELDEKFGTSQPSKIDLGEIEPLYNYLGEDPPYDYYFKSEPPKEEKKCECGSDTAQVPYHSDWCPKHEK